MSEGPAYSKLAPAVFIVKYESLPAAARVVAPAFDEPLPLSYSE
jgi:hypothetical protein